MKRLVYIVVILLMGSTIYSCQESFEVGSTSAEKLAGEWWFAILDENGDVMYDYDYLASRMSTFNTAANSASEIWVDDFQNGWEVKAKVQANVDNLTFGSADSVYNVYIDENMIIRDGQIWEGTATSKDGNVTDSIRFTTVFSDGTILIYAGHRHTGFEEDEYH